MKKAILFYITIGFTLLSSSVFSQSQIKDSLGLIGDNLNLYGVLNIFQESKTLEEFEAKLNSPESKINNLDLNEDNKTDYIKVVDNIQGSSHAIVLQIELSEKEAQDVAVIQVDKDSNGKIKTQIVGDEQLYGKNYIIEPKEFEQKTTISGNTINPGYTGDEKTVINNTTNNYYDNDNFNPNHLKNDYYPISNWHIWAYLYAPSYVIYVSPFHWGVYPHYWNPWAPLYWHEYYGYHYQRYGYYHKTNLCRTPIANSYYGPRRSFSSSVSQRSISGTYRTTYGRRDLLTKSMHKDKIIGGSRNEQQNNNIRRTDKNGRNEIPKKNRNENTPQRNFNEQGKPPVRLEPKLQPRSQPRNQTDRPKTGGRRK